MSIFYFFYTFPLSCFMLILVCKILLHHHSLLHSNDFSSFLGLGQVHGHLSLEVLRHLFYCFVSHTAFKFILSFHEMSLIRMVVVVVVMVVLFLPMLQ